MLRYHSMIDDLPLSYEYDDELEEQERLEALEWIDLQRSIPDAAERNQSLR